MSMKQADILVVDASELLTVKDSECAPKTKNLMNELSVIKNGAVAVKNGKIAAVSSTKEIKKYWSSGVVIDATDKVVMPGFVDCHTHLVFAGSRENREDIYYTVEKTRNASFDDLLRLARKRLDICLKYGTTTIEIKTGYGLSVFGELNMLEVINELKKECWIDIIPTFLGAHVYPKDNSKFGYNVAILWMLSRPSVQKLSEYCDIWCEEYAFPLREAGVILETAKDKGFKIKLHAGQFSDIGAVELGVKCGATSIDHLDFVSDAAIKMMAKTKTIGVLLPGCAFHLMISHYAPARKMIEAGVPIALATDFNPGSSPTMSMQMVIALACRQMKMTPAEAISAATINAAYAVDLADNVGSLEIGKQADIIMLDIPNYLQLPYWFGGNLIELVIKKGTVIFRA